MNQFPYSSSCLSVSEVNKWLKPLQAYIDEPRFNSDTLYGGYGTIPIIAPEEDVAQFIREELPLLLQVGIVVEVTVPDKPAVCPFRKGLGFDLSGLKRHLLDGFCDEFTFRK